MEKTSVEDFPRIVLNLQYSWGLSEGRQYLSDILFERGRHSRQGFPLSVFNEVSFLLDLHDVAFPQFKPKELGDVWGWKNEGDIDPNKGFGIWNLSK